MNENFPKPGAPQTKIEDKENKKQAIIALATEIMNSQEVFLFPGIDQSFYEKQKIEEAPYLEFVTGIDALMDKFKYEGIKISLGKNPEKGEVFVLPAHSDNVKGDSVFLHQLVGAGMEGKLKELFDLVT